MPFYLSKCYKLGNVSHSFFFFKKDWDLHLSLIKSLGVHHKQITMMHSHKQKDDKQIFRKWMMIEKQKKMKDIKIMNKGGKLR